MVPVSSESLRLGLSVSFGAVSVPSDFAQRKDGDGSQTCQRSHNDEKYAPPSHFVLPPDDVKAASPCVPEPGRLPSKGRRPLERIRFFFKNYKAAGLRFFAFSLFASHIAFFRKAGDGEAECHWLFFSAMELRQGDVAAAPFAFGHGKIQAWLVKFAMRNLGNIRR